MIFITPFGLGCLQKKIWERRRSTVPIKLFHAYCGKNKIELERDEVFPFTDWACVRILNVGGAGLISNIQFYGSREEALRELAAPTPQNETKLFIDLNAGFFETSRPVGYPDVKIIWIRPWVDRWATEYTDQFIADLIALEAFEEAKRTGGRSTCGIWVWLLVNNEKRRLMRFSLITADGVVFEKRF